MQLPHEFCSFPTLQLHGAHVAESSAHLLLTHVSHQCCSSGHDSCYTVREGFFKPSTLCFWLCPDQQPQLAFISISQILASANSVPLCPSPSILLYSSSSVLSVLCSYLQIPLYLSAATSHLSSKEHECCLRQADSFSRFTSSFLAGIFSFSLRNEELSNLPEQLSFSLPNSSHPRLFDEKQQ